MDRAQAHTYSQKRLGEIALSKAQAKVAKREEKPKPLHSFATREEAAAYAKKRLEELQSKDPMKASVSADPSSTGKLVTRAEANAKAEARNAGACPIPTRKPKTRKSSYATKAKDWPSPQRWWNKKTSQEQEQFKENARFGVCTAIRLLGMLLTQFLVVLAAFVAALVSLAKKS